MSKFRLTKKERHPESLSRQPQPEPPGIRPVPAGFPPMVPPDVVQKRAFEIYCERKGAPGDALSDWLQAERELREIAQVWGGTPRESGNTRQESRPVQPSGLKESRP
jgi:hypothetical protein